MAVDGDMVWTVRDVDDIVSLEKLDE